MLTISFCFQFPSVIELNVGGTYLTTRLRTLTQYKDSMLEVMFSGRHHVEQDSKGRYLIDRDGKLFHHILNYLRHDNMPPPDMAVDVLKEAQYYQLTDLENWCRRQRSVISNEIVKIAEDKEQRLPGSQFLTFDALAKLAKQSFEGEQSSLVENGENGSLVGKVGVVFVGQQFKVGRESRRFTEKARVWQPFVPLENTCWIGQRLNHHCDVGSDLPLPVHASMVIYGDNVINPVLCVQRAVQQFNQVNRRLQLDLQRYDATNGKAVDAITLWTKCTTCGKEVYCFCFKFLFRAAFEPAESNPDILSICQILEKMSFTGGGLQVFH